MGREVGRGQDDSKDQGRIGPLKTCGAYVEKREKLRVPSVCVVIFW